MKPTTAGGRRACKVNFDAFGSPNNSVFNSTIGEDSKISESKLASIMNPRFLKSFDLGSLDEN
jgi:hypothetical protein